MIQLGTQVFFPRVRACVRACVRVCVRACVCVFYNADIVIVRFMVGTIVSLFYVKPNNCPFQLCYVVII